jgi:hypothetical protein
VKKETRGGCCVCPGAFLYDKEPTRLQDGLYGGVDVNWISAQ